MDPNTDTTAEATETAAAETTAQAAAPEEIKPINLAERLALATEKNRSRKI